MRLPTRAYIAIGEVSGTKTRGLLVSAGQNQLTINDWKADRTVLRSDIRWVFVSHVHTGWATGTGLGLGALVGGLVGALVVPGLPVLGAVVLGTVGAGMGGFVGVIEDFKTSKSHEVLLYYAHAGRWP